MSEAKDSTAKKFIKVTVVLCVFLVPIIAIFLFLNHQANSLSYEYELLDDGTFAVLGVEEDKSADKIVIPGTYGGKPVTVIVSGAFEANPDIKEVIIPESVKTIGSRAFYGCENLTSLDLSRAETIGEEAFAGCVSLQEITIPSSIREIGDSAFSGCAKLESVIFNATECQDLEPSSNLFVGCSEAGLRVEIGKDVKRVPAYLFTSANKDWDRSRELEYRVLYERYCQVTNAQGFYFGNNNTYVMPFEAWVLSKYSYNVYSSLNVTEIVFADESQCREIGTRAFYKTMMESIVFPKSLTSLEEQAVGGCEKLKKITFEDSRNWKTVGNESHVLDLTDENANVDILLDQYANYKIQRSK